MPKFRSAVLAGVALVAAVGTAVAAVHNSHLLKVAMPDGSIARIEYQGDVAPRITLVPAASVAVPIALSIRPHFPLSIPHLSMLSIAWLSVWIARWTLQSGKPRRCGHDRYCATASST
jgi:hypothetical protein